MGHHDNPSADKRDPDHERGPDYARGIAEPEEERGPDFARGLAETDPHKHGRFSTGGETFPDSPEKEVEGSFSEGSEGTQSSD